MHESLFVVKKMQYDLVKYSQIYILANALTFLH